MTYFSPKKDGIVSKMAVICLIGFGGFVAWAGVAPLEEGVAASGQIVVEDNRQVVQHLEGGIVAEIKVRDGQMVKAGDTLMVLQETASLSNRDQIVQEYGALAASVARLKALQNNEARPNFSALDDLDLGVTERADIERRELGLFRQQRSALTADIAVLSARIKASEGVQAARTGQIEIARKALASATSELDVVSSMFAQQLARRDQVTSSERLVATLEGDIARLESERADQAANVLDLEAQIAQSRARTGQTNATELLRASGELLTAEERLNAAQDILNRSVIIAPVDGEVLNLSFSTIGGVVRSGETIMEIVPQIATVTASVQITPADRAAINEGQIVRTQFSSYRGWQAPRLAGEIIGVSADLKTDPATSAVYYEARVRVPASEMDKTTNVEIRPGMPVDVFIFSGRSRTLFDYLIEPLGDSLFKGLRTT
jgi:HlyD family type I secretion membrane fusion protein